MPMTGGTRERWDALPLRDVTDEFFEYLASRYPILREGQPKLVVLFDKGKVRKLLVEAAMGPDAFEALAEHVLDH